QPQSSTRSGRANFPSLNARSSEPIRKRLSALGPGDQDHLLDAMRTIETLLEPQDRRLQPYLLRTHRPGDIGWVVHRHGVLYSEEWGYDERFEALVAQIVSEFVRRYDPDRERCWIAERNGECVGSVFLVGKSKHAAKLRLLLVEPAARGLGIGKRLVEECIRFARQRRYRKIVLWTQSELEAARRIYQQCGFRLTATDPHQSWGRSDRRRLGRDADEDKRPLGPYHPKVRVVIVRSGNGVDDQMEAPVQLLERRRIARDLECACAQSPRVSFLGARRAEYGHLRAHRRRELDRHVAETAETDHAHAIALLAIPLAQRRVRGDPCAEERCGACRVEARRHPENIGLGHYDPCR